MSLQKPIVRLETSVPGSWAPILIKRLQARGFRTMADYLRDLIRRDLEKAGLLEEVITD